MWFRNLQIYRLPANYALTAERLAECLAPQEFVEPTSAEALRAGWIAPRVDGGLVHVVDGQFLIALKTEKKLLPASVVNSVAKAKAFEMEEAQGFPPGKKAMKDLKERVYDELLPRAFTVPSTIHAWIDPVRGWLVIDTGSTSRADDVIKLLLKAIDTFPVQSLRVKRSPSAVMTGWLESDEAPYGFTVDQDADLHATGESRAKVSYKKHTLEPEDIRAHIAAGKQCARLALTWNDRVSFVLDASLAIKRIAPLDVIKEGGAMTHDEGERFDNDFFLMTAELSRMLADVVDALGGEANEQVDIVDEQSKAPAAAPGAWPGKTGASKKRKPEQIDMLAPPPLPDMKNLPVREGAPQASPTPPAPGYRLIYRNDCAMCVQGRDDQNEKCVYCQGTTVRTTTDWYSADQAEILLRNPKRQDVTPK